MPSTVRVIGLCASLFSSVSSTALPARRVQPRQDASSALGNVENCQNGPTSRGCWGNLNINTQMDDQWPSTGKTVKYNLELTNTTMSPDGYPREMLVFNGQYPGPTIEADWGDMVEITVTNNMQNNGTGIHWHGLRQLNSNEQDGVNGVTECPIAPGQSKTYRFQATQYGTSWYHSHYDVQYSEGVVGTIQFNGPATANYDIDLGTLPITDWFHTPVFTVNAASLHAHGPPTAQNALVNGTMVCPSGDSSGCQGGQYAVTTLTPGKKHRLRIINTGINAYFHVGIDGHPMTIIGADFVPIVPYQAESIDIAVGQRYDVIIDANQDVGNYWLRVGTGSNAPQGCDGPNSNAANIRSIIRYDGAPEENPPDNSTNAVQLPLNCNDETQIVPWVSTQVPSDVPEQLSVGFNATYGAEQVVQWLVDGTPMRVNYEYPTLQAALDNNNTFAATQHVYDVGVPDKYTYWVIQQDPTAPVLPHPIHLHGHDFYILDTQANANWTGDTSRLQTSNPIKRDTASLPAGGYIVLAFLADNPGAWLMHCHIPFHISGGLGVQFLERASQISGAVTSNGGNFDTFNAGCASWDSWQQANDPNGVLITGESGV